jgi:hypothetical protein
MFQLISYFIILFLIPSFFIIFRLYQDYIINQERIVAISKELSVLTEKQNILLLKLDKLNVDLSVVENTSTTYLTTSNIFYCLLGLTILVGLGFLFFTWRSGDTAGLVTDAAKVQTDLTLGCSKILSEGLEKLGNHVSTVNNASIAPLADELYKIQVQMLAMESKINMIAVNSGMLGDISPELLNAMHQNSAAVLGF